MAAHEPAQPVLRVCRAYRSYTLDRGQGRTARTLPTSGISVRVRDKRAGQVRSI
jgi:hypothetical protein